MGRLDNKVAVVTGGASNPSLGRSMSIAFAREGAKVILTDIDTEGGKKVEDEILSSNGEAFFVEHDVTSNEGWSEAKNKAQLAISSAVPIPVSYTHLRAHETLR